MVAVVVDTKNKLVLRHFALHYLGLAAFLCALTGAGVAVDSSRPRVSLSCVRHETDPEAGVEDIDCTMIRNAERSSFELGRVSIAPVRQRMGGHMSHEPDNSYAKYFDVLLHRAFPVDAPSIPLFRFSSRAEAERSGGQLEMWMKDAAVSDDDVDEINLQFGSEPWQTWLLVCGGTAVLLAALQVRHFVSFGCWGCFPSTPFGQFELCLGSFSVKLRIFLYRLHIEQVENSVRRYVKPP